MRKNYFLTLLITLCFSALTFGQTAVITGYMDSPCTSQAGRTLEIYVDGTIDFTGWSVVRQSNGGGFDPGSATIDISSLGSVTDAFVYLTNSATTIDTEFGITANVLENSNINGNGDDGWQILNSSSAVVDRLGVDGEDASGTAWDHLDSYLYRMDGATPNAGSFDPANWTFGGINLLDGECGNLSTFVPFGSYAATASTNPSIAITSPVNGQSFDASTTEVPVTLSIQNFTLSGDNGSGMSDGTGMGYILATLQVAGQPDDVSNQFSATPGSITVMPGVTYTLIAELVDNSGNSLSPAVSSTVSFSIDLPCDIQLGDITNVCDNLTSATDTWSSTIAFTQGGTANYTITALDGSMNPVGTVGGDDPSSVAAGNIVITGIPEGTDVSFNITGDSTSSCDLDRTLRSPNCIPFPVVDTFDYTAGGALSAEAAWAGVNSGDDILVASGSLSYSGLETSTGNSVTFDESGAEAFTTFSNVYSGNVYASFLFSVTAFQTNGSPDLTDGGYFAGLASSTTGYDARLWVRPNPDTSGSTFDIGFGHQSSNPTFTAGTYNLNDVIFVVMSYDVDNGMTNVWINPDSSTFGATPPAVTISSMDDFPPSVINTFILRQDSDRETPFIQIDELRIDTSWASVTPAEGTASVIESQIDGFAAYPNPVIGGDLTVKSNSIDQKEVALFNVLGRRVFTQSFTGTQDTFDVSNLSSGIYILKVTEGTKIATQKVVIE
jgi:hypothetical protein